MRVSSSSVDQFTTPVALEQFSERQANGLDVVHAYGLAKTSIVIGGLGLAAQGIDTYVENKKSFDADIVVSDPKFAEMNEWANQTPGVQLGKGEFHFKDEASGMPVSVMSTPLPRNLSESLGAGSYKELLHMSVITEGGISTLPAARLAKAKLARTAVKDISGIVKGQVVAHAMGHEIVSDSDWQFAVKQAMHYAQLRISGSSWLKPSGFPSWMGRLAATNFDHPAFRHSATPVLWAA